MQSADVYTGAAERITSFTKRKKWRESVERSTRMSWPMLFSFVPTHAPTWVCECIFVYFRLFGRVYSAESGNELSRVRNERFPHLAGATIPFFSSLIIPDPRICISRERRKNCPLCTEGMAGCLLYAYWTERTASGAWCCCMAKCTSRLVQQYGCTVCARKRKKETSLAVSPSLLYFSLLQKSIDRTLFFCVLYTFFFSPVIFRARLFSLFLFSNIHRECVCVWVRAHDITRII